MLLKMISFVICVLIYFWIMQIWTKLTKNFVQAEHWLIFTDIESIKRSLGAVTVLCIGYIWYFAVVIHRFTPPSEIMHGSQMTSTSWS